MLGQFVGKITLWGARLKLGEYVPDSGQEHTSHGNNCFFMSAESFDSAVTFPKFVMLFGIYQGIGDLYKKWFQKNTAHEWTFRCKFPFPATHLCDKLHRTGF